MTHAPSAAPSGTFRIGGDLEVRRLGFGAMRVTGPGIWGDPTDPDEARRVLARLPELDVDFVDTADSYGPFVSEDLIREVLHPYGATVIATKGGLTRHGPDVWKPVGRPEYLRQCVLMSLRRLDVERIDLWQLHRIDPAVPRDEQFDVLKQMQDEGLIRHLGLSQVSVEEIQAASEWFEVATVQNLYNLTRRDSEEVLAYCEREGIGFIPWYFHLPKPGHEEAWRQLTDEDGFWAPFGLTTAERRHPQFRKRGCCQCEWDGAVWPFATAQTLHAMANLLNDYEQDVVDRQDYFAALERYVESQYYRGRPYIGEYLDESTGYWLKGDQERSRYYNHSTFNDLVITGLVGLRPRADDTLELNPLLPAGRWDWFCLDALPYHGRTLTIVWDRSGERYKLGPGLRLLVDGKQVAHSERLERLTGPLPPAPDEADTDDP